MPKLNGDLKIEVAATTKGRFRVSAAAGDQRFVDEVSFASESDRGKLASRLAEVFVGFDAAMIRQRLDQLAYQACSPAGGGDGGDGDRSRDSQATLLVKLAESLELWHDPKGDPWMTIDVDGRREHWRLRSKATRRYLSRLFFEQHDKAPNAQAIQDAIGVLGTVNK